MIFPKLIQEEVVQIGDKTRFDLGGSFVTSDEGVITAVEISFDNVNFFNVFVENMPERWFLDYAFNIDGDVTINIKISTALNTETKDYTIKVLSKEQDALFSNDSMLFSEETELRKYIPKGRNSFNYAHRNAQRNVLRFLDGEGVRNVYGVAFTKEQLKDNEYIREFSMYETLMLIFEDLRVKGVDAFKEKKDAYESRYIQAKKNARIKLDYNDDGEIGDNEAKNVVSKFLTR